ncbi:hypothetical protein QBC46DRAFT_391156 [Diplogelasinospora grovesii]|uniref:Secreted protein n=1 Tax=Diplogelasinospora grovesii TaxID=303347 RepID=A0AAN6S2E5_9PEZI|nr:hypothetical protein QBC46DRAFT_391156 [Diplogelasinospora grovesii]
MSHGGFAICNCLTLIVVQEWSCCDADRPAVLHVWKGGICVHSRFSLHFSCCRFRATGTLKIYWFQLQVRNVLRSHHIEHTTGGLV